MKLDRREIVEKNKDGEFCSTNVRNEQEIGGVVSLCALSMSRSKLCNTRIEVPVENLPLDLSSRSGYAAQARSQLVWTLLYIDQY